MLLNTGHSSFCVNLQSTFSLHGSSRMLIVPILMYKTASAFSQSLRPWPHLDWNTVMCSTYMDAFEDHSEAIAGPECSSEGHNGHVMYVQCP